MSKYQNYVLYNNIAGFLKRTVYAIPYMLIVGFLYIIGNIVLSDDIKQIYLIDKGVTTLHTTEKSYSTYNISFYYTNKRDVIYHHKKQPYDIWEQVYYHKNNSVVDINFGVSLGGVLLFIVLLIIGIILGLIYTDEIR